MNMHVTGANFDALHRPKVSQNNRDVLLISHKLQPWSWNWIYRQKAHESSFPIIRCRTEMLWSFCIRIGNISPSATLWHFFLWKWRTTPQKKHPLPLGRRWPPLTQQCFDKPQHHPKPQLRRLRHWRSLIYYTDKILNIWEAIFGLWGDKLYMWLIKFTQCKNISIMQYFVHRETYNP